MTKPAILLSVLMLTIGIGHGDALLAQAREAFRGLPWGGPPGPADPLEPWSLDLQPRVLPPSTAPASPGIVLPTPVDPLSPQDPRVTPVPVQDILGADSLAADAIPVVVLHQIIIGDPNKAVQLRGLFDAAVTWSDARQLLKMRDVQEYTREYAVEDLASQIREEVLALADSSWSSGHPWRGRTMFYQVLARANRSRAGLPELGQGLDAQERARLADLRPKLRQPSSGAGNSIDDPNDGLVQAVIVKQEAPVYPEGAFSDPMEFIDGEVVLVVTIGRQGDVTRIDVDRSSNVVFEEPAKVAAQESEYRSATRNGIPEPGTIRLNYTFKVPVVADPVPATQP